jgi:hypothetical protein
MGEAPAAEAPPHPDRVALGGAAEPSEDADDHDLSAEPPRRGSRRRVEDAEEQFRQIH